MNGKWNPFLDAIHKSERPGLKILLCWVNILIDFYWMFSFIDNFYLICQWNWKADFHLKYKSNLFNVRIQ